MVALKFKLFGFQFIAWYFQFYAIGFFGRKYQNLWEKQGRIGSLWLSILFLFMAYWWMRKDPPLFMTQNSHVIYNYAYKFVVAILAIVAFIPLFKSYLNRTMLIITKMGGNIGYLCYPSNCYCSTYFLSWYWYPTTALLVMCMRYVDNGFNNKLLVSYSNWKEPLLVFVALR